MMWPTHRRSENTAICLSLCVSDIFYCEFWFTEPRADFNVKRLARNRQRVTIRYWFSACRGGNGTNKYIQIRIKLKFCTWWSTSTSTWDAWAAKRQLRQKRSNKWTIKSSINQFEWPKISGAHRDHSHLSRLLNRRTKTDPTATI